MKNTETKKGIDEYNDIEAFLCVELDKGHKEFNLEDAKDFYKRS